MRRYMSEAERRATLASFVPPDAFDVMTLREFLLCCPACGREVPESEADMMNVRGRCKGCEQADHVRRG